MLNFIKKAKSHQMYFFFINFHFRSSRMERKIIKFSSIHETMSPRNFLTEIKRKINLNNEDFQNISHIHVENLRNKRYHLRMCVRNEEIIKKLENESEKNNDGKSYTLKTSFYSFLFMTPVQSNEKFEVVNGNNSERVIKLRTLPQQHILDVLNKIYQYGNYKVDYVSANRTHSFIGLQDKRDVREIMNKFMRDKFEVSYANSFLTVARLTSREPNQHHHMKPNKHNGKQKQNKNHKSQRNNHPYKKPENHLHKCDCKSKKKGKNNNKTKVSLNPLPQIQNSPVPVQQPIGNYTSMPNFPSFNNQVPPLMPSTPMNPSSIPAQHLAQYQTSGTSNNYVHNLYDYEYVLVPKMRRY